MFTHQQRFGLTIAALLLQILTESRAAIVPDKTRWAEPDLAACLLQAPANIDVVPGPMKNRIETAHVRQGPAVKSHVTTGNMFRLAVRQHHVGRPPRRNHHCGGYW